jgi:hypothetical protein
VRACSLPKKPSVWSGSFLPKKAASIIEDDEINLVIIKAIKSGVGGYGPIRRAVDIMGVTEH